jgi:6-pyruvoyltetrahydropterin/6-carboxytetrahydropterin synthase
MNKLDYRRVKTMTTVTKKFNFEAAHFLPGYPGKCANMHGHRWEIAVTARGVIDPDTGFVVDFSDIKKKVVIPVQNLYDHRVLNECPPFNKGLRPTAENLGKEVFLIAMLALEREGLVRVQKVRVWETPDNWTTIYRDDVEGL